MFWKVHWMYFDYQDEEQHIDDFEYVVKCSEYQAAFGEFISHTCDKDIARCWVTSHIWEPDTEGKIMLVYANDCDDRIELNW